MKTLVCFIVLFLFALPSFAQEVEDASLKEGLEVELTRAEAESVKLWSSQAKGGQSC